MIPNTPRVNLFQLMLRDLGTEARRFGTLVMQYKWELAIVAAVVVVLIFLFFRGNRQ